MAEEESTEEKTEAPSEKRRQDAREKGNVAKSTEINSVLVLLAALFLLKVFGPWELKELSACIVEFINITSDIGMTDTRAMDIIIQCVWICIKLTMPIAFGILLIGVVANIIQVGFLWTMKPLIPKFEKIDPIAGTKRMLSMRSLVETLKNSLKLLIIGFVAYLTIKNDFDKLIILANTSVLAIWSVTAALAFKIILRISLVLIILAILDYAYQRWEHERKLKMSPKEVKEERKELEGDPQIKARVRSLQREMARRRMMEQVPKATVVVTNPTHIAIALKYEPEENDAPVVVAKGKRLIAERIKQLARDAGVPVVEDKPLARAMYDKIDVGFPIPMEFFTAVAEIMAYVYRLRNRSAA